MEKVDVFETTQRDDSLEPLVAPPTIAEMAASQTCGRLVRCFDQGRRPCKRARGHKDTWCRFCCHREHKTFAIQFLIPKGQKGGAVCVSAAMTPLPSGGRHSRTEPSSATKRRPIR